MAGRTDRKTLKAWLTPCRSGCREYAPPQRADPRPQQKVGENKRLFALKPSQIPLTTMNHDKIL